MKQSWTPHLFCDLPWPTGESDKANEITSSGTREEFIEKFTLPASVLNPWPWPAPNVFKTLDQPLLCTCRWPTPNFCCWVNRWPGQPDWTLSWTLSPGLTANSWSQGLVKSQRNVRRLITSERNVRGGQVNFSEFIFHMWISTLHVHSCWWIKAEKLGLFE